MTFSQRYKHVDTYFPFRFYFNKKQTLLKNMIDFNKFQVLKLTKTFFPNNLDLYNHIELNK